MDFKLDKQDIFRNVVPGSIFMLVIFSFFLAEHQFSVKAINDIQPIEFILGIAITLPIGYIIHNVYFAFHVILFEQRHWYAFENAQLRGILGTNSPTIKLKNSPRLGSWFIEICLHEDGCKTLRERFYELISRLHSRGASIVSIALAFIISIKIFQLGIGERSRLFLFPAVAWFIITVALLISRRSAFLGYRAFMEHFILVRKKLIIDTATGIDPFSKR
jgi:hypothetical protein